MIFVGIDPGLKGGWAFLNARGDIQQVGIMPTQGADAGRREIDVLKLRDLLPREPTLVTIERVNPVQGASLISTWQFARTFEALISLCKLSNWSYTLVRPQDWKQEILPGTRKDKQAALDWCRRKWPMTELKGHDGMGDALCIAEYGRRKSVLILK